MGQMGHLYLLTNWEGFPPYREKREGSMKRRGRTVDAFKKFDDKRKFKTAC